MDVWGGYSPLKAIDYKEGDREKETLITRFLVKFVLGAPGDHFCPISVQRVRPCSHLALESGFFC